MKNFFYFISESIFLICDPEFCKKNVRSFDMSFNDLANNEKLLNLLGLYYIQGNYGVTYTYDSRAHWFSGYISAFSSPNENDMYEKLQTNPTVRLLIMDEKLFEEVKKVLIKG
jgi:hypothetical protein